MRVRAEIRYRLGEKLPSGGRRQVPKVEQVMRNQTLDIDGRLQFIGLGSADREAIRQCGPIVLAKLDDILDDLYAAIFAMPQTATIIGDKSRVPGLKAAQEAHWRRRWRLRSSQRLRRRARAVMKSEMQAAA